MKHCPIATARKIGEAAGASRVVVILLDDKGKSSATSWGKSRGLCQSLGEWIDLFASRVAGHIEGWTLDDMIDLDGVWDVYK